VQIALLFRTCLIWVIIAIRCVIVLIVFFLTRFIDRRDPKIILIWKFDFNFLLGSVLSSAAHLDEIYACVFLDRGHREKKLGTRAVRRCRYDFIDLENNCLSGDTVKRIYHCRQICRLVSPNYRYSDESLQIYASLCICLYRSDYTDWRSLWSFESGTFRRIGQFEF